MKNKNHRIYEEYFQRRLKPDAISMKRHLSYILKNKYGSVKDFIIHNDYQIYTEFIENGLICSIYELNDTNEYMQLSWKLNYNKGNIARNIYIRLYGLLDYIKLMCILPKHKI